MAKDPAFLFYTSDFLTGTMFMSNEQIGIYVKLLCSQHQHGGLIDKTSFSIMVGDNPMVRSKFIETDEGFYNIRLSEEMGKRSIKSTNLSEAAKKIWEERKNKKRKKQTKDIQLHNNSNTNVIQPEDENEDVNKNIITLDVFLVYCKEILKEKYIPLEFSLKAKYEAWVNDGWRDGHGTKIKNWKTKIKNTIPFMKPEYIVKKETTIKI